MRILRFSAFFVSALFCFTGWSQTPQTAPAQQPAPTQIPDRRGPPAQPPSPSAQPPFSIGVEDQQPVDTHQTDKFKLKLFPAPAQPKQKKLPTGIVDRGFRAALEQTAPRPQLRAIQQQPKDFVPPAFQGDFDPGIRIDTSGGNMCGAIVSYNFTRSAPGEMPRLKSVTTCTPSNKVVPRRTEHKQGKPRGPTLLQAVLPE